eukprot:TRINITY_DN12205_c0_g2_i2.p1 TRINITY_DN12205_c0_g2~~TRINITY_DN12205_c0_g2_i2.p1  ORF type:complete len:814 (+),score=145.35 TRINITY_DN12205_c0_g2_i2:34-2442(+)
MDMPFEVHDYSIIANGTLQAGSYVFGVQANDLGRPSMSDDAIVNITVIASPQNEYAPQFSQPSYSAVILEDRPAGSNVLRLDVFDADNTTDGIDFSIVSSSHPGVFEIIPAGDNGHGNYFCLVLLDRPLDYEVDDHVYNLVIRATDKHALDPLAKDVTVRISLFDVNDNPPQFVHNVLSATVFENTPLAAHIFDLEHTDLDILPAHKQFYYRVIDSTNTFALGSDQTSIVTSTVLDAEAEYAAEGSTVVVNGQQFTQRPREHIFSAQVWSRQPLRGTGASLPSVDNVTLRVQVLDANDNSPVFGIPQTTVQVNEHADGLVVPFSVTDADVTSPNNLFDCDILSQPVVNMFELNALTLNLIGDLDRETQPAVQTIVVRCADRGSPQLSTAGADGADFELKVEVQDVNDHTPVIEEITIADVPEDFVGRIGSVVARDDDATAPNNNLTYDVISPNVPFAMNGSDVYVTARLDYEARTSYTVTIQVSDGASGADKRFVSQQIIINVSNDTTDTATSRGSAVPMAAGVAGGSVLVIIIAILMVLHINRRKKKEPFIRTEANGGTDTFHNDTFLKQHQTLERPNGGLGLDAFDLDAQVSRSGPLAVLQASNGNLPGNKDTAPLRRPDDGIWNPETYSTTQAAHQDYEVIPDGPKGTIYADADDVDLHRSKETRQSTEYVDMTGSKSPNASHMSEYEDMSPDNTEEPVGAAQYMEMNSQAAKTNVNQDEYEPMHLEARASPKSLHTTDYVEIEDKLDLGEYAEASDHRATAALKNNNYEYSEHVRRETEAFGYQYEAVETASALRNGD